jgi:hypothetical protein
MRELLIVSPWFYLGDTSLLDWLTLCSVLSLLVLLVRRLFHGISRKVLAGAAVGLAMAGVLASIGMLWVEVRIFESGEPWCVAAWAVLLVSFLILIRHSRSGRSMAAHLATAFVLAGAALTYLNFYGLIPTVSRIAPGQLEGLEGSKMLGQRAGTLLITEFADFQCPACAVEDDAMDRLWGTFPGRIQYNFRNLPLIKLHQHARAAALAGECAAEEGKFWETKRLFFANQRQLPALLSEPAPPTIPPELEAQYSRCIASNAAWSEVQKDLEQARRLGLHGTPTIVIGDKLVHGMLTYPRLALVVREELKARNLLQARQASARQESGCGSPRETRGCTLE